MQRGKNSYKKRQGKFKGFSMTYHQLQVKLYLDEHVCHWHRYFKQLCRILLHHQSCCAEQLVLGWHRKPQEKINGYLYQEKYHNSVHCTAYKSLSLQELKRWLWGGLFWSALAQHYCLKKCTCLQSKCNFCLLQTTALTLLLKSEDKNHIYCTPEWPGHLMETTNMFFPPTHPLLPLPSNGLSTPCTTIHYITKTCLHVPGAFILQLHVAH